MGVIAALSAIMITVGQLKAGMVPVSFEYETIRQIGENLPHDVVVLHDDFAVIKKTQIDAAQKAISDRTNGEFGLQVISGIPVLRHLHPEFRKSGDEGSSNKTKYANVLDRSITLNGSKKSPWEAIKTLVQTINAGEGRKLHLGLPTLALMVLPPKFTEPGIVTLPSGAMTARKALCAILSQCPFPISYDYFNGVQPQNAGQPGPGLGLLSIDFYENYGHRRLPKPHDEAFVHKWAQELHEANQIPPPKH